MFSDGGTPSYGRVASGFIVAFALGWGTAILATQHKIDADNVATILQTAAYFYVGAKISTVFATKVSAATGETKSGPVAQ